MPVILVTNDDGVHSEGIRALADALTPLGEVTIVAPQLEASAIGHALTLRRPLRLEKGLPTRTLLNINVPRAKAKGFRVTVQAKRNHITSVAESVDPRGQPYYWIEEGESDWEPHDRSDYQAVIDGYISITPLQPDLTDHTALAHVETFPFPREVAVE